MWWGPSRNLTNKNSAGARACARRLWGILTKCKKVKARAHARARAGDGEF